MNKKQTRLKALEEAFQRIDRLASIWYEDM